jgi:glycine/D-amino acid oxidase-like deaminating enzyme
VFGVWTAHHLAESGARVTLVDAYGPGNSRSSSGDESRILRCGYGPDDIYSRFADRSRQQWRALDARHESGVPLWHPCGVLWIAPAGHAYAADTLATLRRGSYAVEELNPEVARSRYPQFDVDSTGLLMLEPDGGAIMARRSVQVLAAELSRTGVRIQHGRVEQPSGRGRLQTVRMSDGTVLAADRFVFACGPWLPKTFPELLGRRIFATRQVVMYFGAPAGDDRFSASHTPAWIDLGAGIYGIPDLEGRGLKVGIDARGAPFDPESDERIVDRESIDQARRWLARRLPRLAAAPIIESRVCQYENTATGDFVIDHHPAHENAWIVGGGSGHGFKHGPAVGEYLVQLMTGGASSDARFAIEGPGVEQRVIF